MNFFNDDFFGKMFTSVDIGIDLGTANILVFLKGRGIVLREPSVVAMDKATGKIMAMGKEAKEMLGRTPDNIVAVRPMRRGVIADYDITQMMLESIIKRVAGKSLFFKPRVMICIPARVTTVEKRAVLEATVQAGAAKTFLIEEPMAAAMGANLNVNECRGAMVMDIGGGTSDVAVISLGGIVVAESLRIGGDDFDEAIVRYVKKERNLLLSDSAAEEIKMKIGTVSKKLGKTGDEVIHGSDLITGLPATALITPQETTKALAEPLGMLLACIKRVLEKTPPELAGDIIERGIVLTGGGALLDGIAERIEEGTGITTTVAESPLDCVALGTGKALANISALKDSSELEKYKF
jgi:rod shape-determining protein MreB